MKSGISSRFCNRPITAKIELWIEMITSFVLSSVEIRKMYSQLGSWISQWGPNTRTEDVFHRSLEDAQ